MWDDSRVNQQRDVTALNSSDARIVWPFEKAPESIFVESGSLYCFRSVSNHPVIADRTFSLVHWEGDSWQPSLEGSFNLRSIPLGRGRFAALDGDDRNPILKVYDLPSGKIVMTIENQNWGPIKDLSLYAHRASNQLAVMRWSDRSCEVWDYGQGKKEGQQILPQDLSVAGFAGDNQLWARDSGDNLVKIDIVSKKREAIMPIKSDTREPSLRFDFSGRSLAVSQHSFSRVELVNLDHPSSKIEIDAWENILWDWLSLSRFAYLTRSRLHVLDIDWPTGKRANHLEANMPLEKDEFYAKLTADHSNRDRLFVFIIYRSYREATSSFEERYSFRIVPVPK